MKHLDRQTATLTQNGGKFEKWVNNVTPGPATRGLSPSALAEPEAPGEGLTLELTTISQEARRPMGTSQEPPAAVTGSSPSTSKVQDAGIVATPQSTRISEVAAISTTIWQSSAVYQSGSSLWAEEKATGAPSTPAPSTQVPTTSHSTLEENIGSEGQPQWAQEQGPSPEKSLGLGETIPSLSARTDAFQNRGPGNTVHPSAAPTSSEETPSPELVASGTQAPTVKETFHATADPQKLSVFITAVPDSQAATRRQAVGLLAFLGLLFCLGVAMFAYQSLQGCPRKMAGEMVEGLRYVPRSCGSNSYVLVPV